MTREEAINKLKELYLRTDITDDYGEIVDMKPYNDAVNMAIKALEQEPKTGYISIDDVMSVFDDFMCGEVDEDGTDTFLEMLKDKAESEK